jgi:hypothetical protein
MKKELVKTSNYERFRTAITAVENRGAPEASMLLVAGDPGFSKSIIVNRWAVEQRAVYLRAKVNWTPRAFLRELARALNVDNTGRADGIFARVCAVIGKEQMPIIIDEVQHTLADRARVLEAVRDVSDLTETIVVLVAGEESVQQKIARYPQISSRILKMVEFHAASVEDVRRCCKDLPEDLDIAADLADEIHKQSAGRMRDVINAIALVEHTAKRNGKKKVALADFAGKALVNNWQTRRAAARAS